MGCLNIKLNNLVNMSIEHMSKHLKSDISYV